MIQLTLGTFKFALVSPAAGYVPTIPGTTDEYDADITFPKFEASYSLKTEAFFVDVFGGFQTYELEDTTVWQAMFVATFKVSEQLALEAGVGYANAENDLVDESDEQMQYYVNALISIAPGFFIVPEVGMIDWMEDADDNDQGEDFYAGLKWQIDF